MKTQNTTFVRASISFPADVYRVLENLAKKKKVSLAWVVREAAEKYIALGKTRSNKALGR
jgi:predicted DNA-binding protein